MAVVLVVVREPKLGSRWIKIALSPGRPKTAGRALGAAAEANNKLNVVEFARRNCHNAPARLFVAFLFRFNEN